MPEDYEQRQDDALLRAEDEPVAEPESEPTEETDEDPEEDPMETDPVAPTPTEDPEEDIDWTDIHMHPLPTRGSPPPSLPPWSPLPVDAPEEPIPDDEEMETTPETDHGMPPPPIPVVAAVEHNWIVAHLTADLVEADARVGELRLQLAEERRTRLVVRREGGDFPAGRMRSAIRRIERGARSRLRSLPVTRSGLVSRSEVEWILAGAMMRARDTTRFSGRR